MALVQCEYLWSVVEVVVALAKPVCGGRKVAVVAQL
jgi:hypothetical protein